MRRIDNSSRFYVYLIFDLTGTPRYVGKGTGGRWKQHFYGSKPTKISKLIRAFGGDLPVVMIREGITNAQALELEGALISAIGREVDGGPLVNITTGGEGVPGLIHTSASRRRMSESTKGTPNTEAQKKKISEALRGRVISAETRSRLSEAAKKRYSDPAERERAGLIRRGKKVSLERRILMGMSQRLRKRTDEERANISAGLREHWRKRRLRMAAQ